ncbi:MAG: S-layer homology domain-containing protein [Oscillospiraceae bacterium]|jgi:hypothetical protein|nr:S-layer homology domain-containing protein [Oscillospiraceae bacterium]
MQNLKKLLCVVLAVVMAMSLVTIAPASAAVKTLFNDFKDLDKIDVNKKESVDLLNALGILEGLETGYFNPEGALQRDAAVKIVAYIVLGKNAADAIRSNTPTRFVDVPASHWASGYIAWADNAGIVNGVDDTHFNPTRSVTVNEFTKLLLAALGYGAKGEYVGVNWAANVVRDATYVNYDIPATAAANRGAAITRQDSAVLIHQTLFIDIVEYSELFGSYGSILIASTTLHETFNYLFYNVEARYYAGDDFIRGQYNVPSHLWTNRFGEIITNTYWNGKVIGDFYADNSTTAGANSIKGTTGKLPATVAVDLNDGYQFNINGADEYWFAGTADNIAPIAAAYVPPSSTTAVYPFAYNPAARLVFIDLGNWNALYWNYDREDDSGLSFLPAYDGKADYVVRIDELLGTYSVTPLGLASITPDATINALIAWGYDYPPVVPSSFSVAAKQGLVTGDKVWFTLNAHGEDGITLTTAGTAYYTSIEEYGKSASKATTLNYRNANALKYGASASGSDAEWIAGVNFRPTSDLETYPTLNKAITLYYNQDNVIIGYKYTGTVALKYAFIERIAAEYYEGEDPAFQLLGKDREILRARVWFTDSTESQIVDIAFAKADKAEILDKPGTSINEHEAALDKYDIIGLPYNKDTNDSFTLLDAPAAWGLDGILPAGDPGQGISDDDLNPALNDEYGEQWFSYTIGADGKYTFTALDITIAQQGSLEIKKVGGGVNTVSPWVNLPGYYEVSDSFAQTWDLHTTNATTYDQIKVEDEIIKKVGYLNFPINPNGSKTVQAPFGYFDVQTDGLGEGQYVLALGNLIPAVPFVSPASFETDNIYVLDFGSVADPIQQYAILFSFVAETTNVATDDAHEYVYNALKLDELGVPNSKTYTLNAAINTPGDPADEFLYGAVAPVIVTSTDGTLWAPAAIGMYYIKDVTNEYLVLQDFSGYTYWILFNETSLVAYNNFFTPTAWNSSIPYTTAFSKDSYGFSDFGTQYYQAIFETVTANNTTAYGGADFVATIDVLAPLNFFSI